MFYDWFSLLVSTVKKLVWNLINGKRLWKKLILLYQPIWDKKKCVWYVQILLTTFPWMCPEELHQRLSKIAIFPHIFSWCISCSSKYIMIQAVEWKSLQIFLYTDVMKDI